MRRLLLLAGKDIGLADPMVLSFASAAAHASQFMGGAGGSHFVPSHRAEIQQHHPLLQSQHTVMIQWAPDMPPHLRDTNQNGTQLEYGAG